MAMYAVASDFFRVFRGEMSPNKRRAEPKKGPS